MPVTFGLTILPRLPIEQQVAMAVLAERLGFQRAWWPDHMLFPDGTPGLDCWTVMTVAAARTRRIQLATGVSDPHRVPPAVFAQRAATLDQFSRGRLVVGLGSGESMNLDPFGLPWADRKVARLREFIQVFHGLLGGQPFTFQGDFHQCRATQLSVRPYENRKIPIFMAALGPQMQKLAGQLADGWFPVSIPAPDYAGYFEPIAVAAREAGRAPEQIERAAMMVVAVLPDGQTISREALLRVARPFAGTLVWPVAARRMGFAWNPPAHLADISYHSVNLSDPESVRLFQQFSDWIPDDLLLQFLHAGDRYHLRRVFERYLEAGVTHLQIYNASPDPLASFACLGADLIPALTGQSPTLFARGFASTVKVARRFGLTRRLVPLALDIWRGSGV